MKERRNTGINCSFCFDSEDQRVLVQGRFPCAIAKILKYPSMGLLVSNGLLTSRSGEGMFAKDSEELKVMILAILGVIRTRHGY